MKRGSPVPEDLTQESSPSRRSPQKKYAMGWTNAQQGQRHPPLRRDHSCVQHNNFAIIYGGYQSKPLGDMWVLDCVSMVWSQLTHQRGKDKHPGKRCGHSTVLCNGKIWLFGGETDNSVCLNDVWSFDISLKEWTKEIPEEGPLPPPRYGHAALIVGTSMFIFGGANKRSECYDDFWCFETTTNTWSNIQTDPMPSKRHGHTITVVSPNKILLFGGYGPDDGRLNDLWEFDPYIFAWSPVEVIGKSPSRRAYHGAVSLRSRLFIFGGQGPTALGDFWQYTPGARQWKHIQSGREHTERGSDGTGGGGGSGVGVVPQNVLWPAARYGHIATTFGGDSILIFGGLGDGHTFRDDLWKFYIDLAIPQESDLEGNAVVLQEGGGNSRGNTPMLASQAGSDLWSQLSQVSEDTRNYLKLEDIPVDKGDFLVKTDVLRSRLQAVRGGGSPSIASQSNSSAIQQKLQRRIADLEKQLHAQRNEFTQYRASAARELEVAKEEQSALIQEAVSIALANQRKEFEATLHSIEHRLSKRGSLPQGQEGGDTMQEQIEALQKEVSDIKKHITDKEEEEARHMVAFGEQIQQTISTTDTLYSLMAQYLDK